MSRPSMSLVALGALLLTGCVFPDDTPASGYLQAEVADKYVHRGLPHNRNAVAQGELGVSLPTVDGGELHTTAWANMDLRDTTGRAWFPGGHAGEFSQIDFTASYARSVDVVDLQVGVHNYNLPFGAEFPFGARSATTEVFVHASVDVLGARPEVRLRWDVDEVGGFYGKAGVTESLEITEDLSAHGEVFVGYADSEHSMWLYKTDVSAFSDLHGSLALSYALQTDDSGVRTALGAHIDASTILDHRIRAWFDRVGVADTNLWGGVFVRWSF